MSDYRSAEYIPLPPTGASRGKEDELCRAVDSRIQYGNLLWGKLSSRWRKPELYDQSEQWLQQAFSASNSSAPWQWVPIARDPNDPTSLPTPVFNYGLAPRVNETARLARPQYQPDTRPNSDNPSIGTRIACKRMTRALLAEMYRMRWSTEADIGHYRMPLHGTWLVKSWWEQRWDETTQVPVQGAVSCPEPGCEFRLASPRMAPQQASQLGMALPDVHPAEMQEVEAGNCPTCEHHPPLQPYTPSADELGTKDALGRPLSTPKPLGQWAMRTLSPYDVFLPNLGVGLRYDSIPEWTEVHVETLDWVALHFPEQAARVKKENPAKLMEYHPIGGSPTLYGRGEAGALFNHHVRIKEHHEKPRMESQPGGTYKLNKGRTVITANDVVLMDADYLMPSLTKPGEQVERAVLELIPWEFKEGAGIAYGMSMWDIMYGAQDTVNEVRSQTAAVRERGAVPFYLVDKSASFEIPEQTEGVPFRILSLDITPGNTVDGSFKLVNNSTISDGVYKEAESAIMFINDSGQRSEVDRGGVPPGVSAATAISQLRQESGTSREQRQSRISNSLRRLYSHGAKLLTALWLEPRTFKWDSGGKEQWDRATGFDFESQTEVELAPEPKFDTQDAKREAIRDIVQLLGPRMYSPEGKRIARALDAPPELYEEDDIQEEQAEREWEHFIKQSYRPVVDPTLDAHPVHWDQHGRSSNDERFRELEEKAGWDSALRILGASWFQDLQMLASQPPIPDTVLVSGMTGRAVGTDPMTGQPLDPSAQPMPYPQAMAMGIVPQQQPQDLQDRIEQHWSQKLAAWGFQSPDPQALQQVITWRAHSESHRLLAEQRQAMAQMQPSMAAPGAQQTMAGTEVTADTAPENIAGQAPMPGQSTTKAIPAAPIPSPRA